MNILHVLEEKITSLCLWEDTLLLERNEFLGKKGAIENCLYFVISGSLRIFIVDEAEEHIIRFGYKNNFITALDSYITGKPSQLFIQAIKKTELKVISKIKFETFVESSTENLNLWHKILEQLIFQQMEREQDLLTSSPVERYNRVLTRSPQLFQEIPHKHIASYLRMAPETLSRIKKN